MALLLAQLWLDNAFESIKPYRTNHQLPVDVKRGASTDTSLPPGLVLRLDVFDVALLTDATIKGSGIQPQLCGESTKGLATAKNLPLPLKQKVVHWPEPALLAGTFGGNGRL